jgi:CDP-paratose 2-epimerase
MRILITGGAGFVGSSLALAFRGERAAQPSHEIVAFDNLKRRGSELNLERFRQHHIEFVHGDVRNPDDLAALHGHFDVIIDAAAEPSVQAGLDGAVSYVLGANLIGTLNSLEFARKRAGAFVFLSTSRVYSIAPLRELALEENDTRFALAAQQPVAGVGAAGIAENFPVHLPRSLYGATKLASEHLVQEYAASLGLKAVINRCGVIAGPGQFGKVDQGVFTLWVANHVYKKPLGYTGFGGTGKQVRDLLHPDDLYRAIQAELEALSRTNSGVNGEIFNLGGGQAGSTSLAELTAICQRVTGHNVPLASQRESSSVDIPFYVSDCSKAKRVLNWEPKRRVDDIVRDIHGWLQQDPARFAALFGASS